jgi:hypothetical protein
MTSSDLSGSPGRRIEEKAMIKKEEFMKAQGFVKDPENMAWINATQRIWVSHEVVTDHPLTELTQKIPMKVPPGEFYFHSISPLSESFCIAILKRLNLPDLKPVNHTWPASSD